MSEQNAQPNILTMALLASAFKAVHATDAAAQRSADKALEHLSTAPVLDFDATELRVVSQDGRKARQGTHYVAAPEGCTCDGARHPWCKHRTEYRLMLAELALRDPAELLRVIREQAGPADADSAAVEAAPALATVAREVAGDEDAPGYLDAIVAAAEQDPIAARYARRPALPKTAQDEIDECFA